MYVNLFLNLSCVLSAFKMLRIFILFPSFGPWHLLVLGAGPDVGLQLTAVQCGVPHTPIVRGHVNLGPHCTLLTSRASLLHLLPHSQVLLHTWIDTEYSYLLYMLVYMCHDILLCYHIINTQPATIQVHVFLIAYRGFKYRLRIHI